MEIGSIMMFFLIVLAVLLLLGWVIYLLLSSMRKPYSDEGNYCEKTRSYAHETPALREKNRQAVKKWLQCHSASSSLSGSSSSSFSGSQTSFSGSQTSFSGSKFHPHSDLRFGKSGLHSGKNGLHSGQNTVKNLRKNSGNYSFYDENYDEDCDDEYYMRRHESGGEEYWYRDPDVD